MMRPSCGSRFSLMSSLDMILMRLVIASRILIGRVHHRVQHAVDAVPDAILFFVRLDVNVARAALDRICQNQVHQFDDRRLLGSFSKASPGPSPVFRSQLQIRAVISVRDLS